MMVVRDVAGPFFSTNVTVSTVPVDGDQVIGKGDPAVTSGALLNEKGFCALTRVARVAKMRGVIKRIFARTGNRSIKEEILDIKCWIFSQQY
jgi:hypothetical protein